MVVVVVVFSYIELLLFGGKWLVRVFHPLEETIISTLLSSFQQIPDSRWMDN